MKHFLQSISTFILLCFFSSVEAVLQCQPCNQTSIGEICDVSCPNLPKWTVTCTCGKSNEVITLNQRILGQHRNVESANCTWNDISECESRKVDFRIFVITSGVLTIVTLFLLGSTIYLLSQQCCRRNSSTTHQNEFTNKSTLEMEQIDAAKVYHLTLKDSVTDETDDDDRYQKDPTRPSAQCIQGASLSVPNQNKSDIAGRAPSPLPRGKFSISESATTKTDNSLTIGSDDGIKLSPPPRAPTRKKRQTTSAPNLGIVSIARKDPVNTMPSFYSRDSTEPAEFNAESFRSRTDSANSSDGYDNDPVAKSNLPIIQQLSFHGNKPPKLPPPNANLKAVLDSDEETGNYYEEPNPVKNADQHTFDDYEEEFDN